MPRRTWALAAVHLLTAAVLSIALLAGSDTSRAENGLREGSAAGTSVAEAPLPDGGGEQSPGEAQYPTEQQGQGGPRPVFPGEGDVHRKPPQGVDSSPRVALGSSETSVYHRFYGRWLGRVGDEPEVVKVEETPSEGSAPGVRAPERALSVMEPPTPYSQIVDNASPQRFFSGRGWKKSPRSGMHHGGNLEYTRPAEGATPARFEVEIPADGHYAVYARWSAAKGNNPAARFRVETASGIGRVEVNQRKYGGMWVRLGAYEMEAGNRRFVRIAGRSKAEGRVVADAVMVVRGTQAAPQEGRSEDTYSGGTPGASARGSEVVERARTHLGTPYRHSPPLPCQAYRSEDCSCLTSLVFGDWLTLPDDPVQQWQVGRSVERSDLLPGDLVFFKEAGEGNPITHVGIYSGGGNIIHSSSYWGGVVERPMKYVSGYYGAKRPN